MNRSKSTKEDPPMTTPPKESEQARAGKPCGCDSGEECWKCWREPAPPPTTRLQEGARVDLEDLERVDLLVGEVRCGSSEITPAEAESCARVLAALHSERERARRAEAMLFLLVHAAEPLAKQEPDDADWRRFDESLAQARAALSPSGDEPEARVGAREYFCDNPDHRACTGCAMRINGEELRSRKDWARVSASPSAGEEGARADLDDYARQLLMRFRGPASVQPTTTEEE